ncbi:putative peptidoglycan lipid II flippase [Kineococcus xinjiangensis]|uniref:Putative peptidoglycan lipid II flippase n=1 Tax=Kineococcus xinjiangensis TaxID=512762 RepID=A0A2S6IC83_9ACTN|nr:lipid II flippase MurJ [Kineococcus xinjiangensis]PPK90861.1 putative peptidoglycan lipid II flippase [Kineococcus xinjiangensis]
MRPVRTLAAAAVTVAAITVLARVAGFGRVVVFSDAVGDNCLGDVYNTANLVPNVLFEVVAGGMLAGALVPVLAGPLAAGTAEGRERASRTASAVLTWAVLALVLVAVLTAVLARPVADLLLQDKGTECPGALPLAVGMLYVFLPQVPLYGVAVVLGGALQAQRRFTASAVAPLASSLVVMAAYAVFAAALPGGTDLASAPLSSLPGGALAVLTWGTTLGVLAMALTHAPALRSQIRWRPALRPAPGDGAALRRLALAGLTILFAQQAVAVTAVALANDRAAGSVTQWGWAWTLFLLPYAVLAVPVATAVFPRLAAASGPRAPDLAALLASTARLVTLASAAGAAGLAAAALPIAAFFLLGDGSPGDPGDLATALVVFAPALLGYGLTALLVRTLYAVGRGRAAAVAATAGWLLVLGAAPLLVLALPPERVVTALALAHTLGLTLAGVLLVIAVRRACGVAALAGLPRAVLAGAVAALLAGGAGHGVASVLPLATTSQALVAGVVAGAVAGLLWLAVVALLDRRDVAALAGRFARVLPVRGARAPRAEGAQPDERDGSHEQDGSRR